MNKCEVEKKFYARIQETLELVISAHEALLSIPAGQLSDKGADDVMEGLFEISRNIEARISFIATLDENDLVWTTNEFHNIFWNGLQEITAARTSLHKEIFKQKVMHKAYRWM
jgi:hypothetical protein